MTHLLYLDDSYLREFSATVIDVTHDGVILDRTAFYPGGGGQPHDTGRLITSEQQWCVVSAEKHGDQVIHRLDRNESPALGTELHGEIDWERRYRLMRTHTAMHALCGTIFREYGALVTGGNMGLERARMDFELEDLSPDRVTRIAELTNENLQRELPVEWRLLPREEAFKIPDLIRTKVNLLPPSIHEIRIVEIKGLDLQADGGTHVRNTSEVGRITIVGTRSKGRINKRIEIALVDADDDGQSRVGDKE